MNRKYGLFDSYATLLCWAIIFASFDYLLWQIGRAAVRGVLFVAGVQ